MILLPNNQLQEVRLEVKEKWSTVLWRKYNKVRVGVTEIIRKKIKQNLVVTVTHAYVVLVDEF